MHILMIILGLAAAGAFWWYRLKYMSEAASEVVDQVGRVRGHFRRKNLRNKAAISPISAINDPVIAAATVALAIASEDAVPSEALTGRLRDAIEPIAASPDKLTEAVTYARWASDQVADVPVVIDETSKLLAARLDEPEKEQLVALVQSIVLKNERHAMYPQRIDRLRRKLGLAAAQ